MDWFQQEEPIRRRPPRQLRSRTIGQVTWASEYGYRNYDPGEGVLSEETRELLPNKPQGSWYGSNTRWDEVRHLLYDPRPSPENPTAVHVMETVQEALDVPETEIAPQIISLEGQDVEPEKGSFAVLSQYLINKMDKLERQF